MILAALLLQAAVPATAVESERAFAADAQALGQWTAFRKWAAPDALLLPSRANVNSSPMMRLPDPPRAVAWQPALSVVSCDGSMAANTGPTRWPNGRAGYFSTIWRKGADGWRWTINHGDFTAEPRSPWGAAPQVRRAACGGRRDPLPRIAFRCAPQAGGQGSSHDGTLVVEWYISCGGRARGLHVYLWDGSGWDQVIHDSVALEQP